jgi:hypothetical protein
VSIASTHDLAEATATVIAFGHCGKILPGMSDPVVRRQLAELLDLVARAESVLVGFDGFPGSTAGAERSGDDPERLTPLEQHMENLLEHKTGPTDEVYQLASAATDDLIEAGRRLRAMAHKLELAREHAKPLRPNAHSEQECAEFYCASPVTRRKQAGRCDACYEWRRAWQAEHEGEVAPPVPERVIEARKQRTEKRRVRVSGPLAEDGAA